MHSMLIQSKSEFDSVFHCTIKAEQAIWLKLMGFSRTLKRINRARCRFCGFFLISSIYFQSQHNAVHFADYILCDGYHSNSLCQRIDDTSAALLHIHSQRMQIDMGERSSNKSDCGDLKPSA